MSSVAYWYAEEPCRVAAPPQVARRMPVLRDVAGKWLQGPKTRCPGRPVKMTPEMRKLKRQWAKT